MSRTMSVAEVRHWLPVIAADAAETLEFDPNRLVYPDLPERPVSRGEFRRLVRSALVNGGYLWGE